MRTQFKQSKEANKGQRQGAVRRGQALVELALMGLLLALLLAGVIDFGRAYYTSVIVENMAGEGAAYAALYPGREYRNNTCSIETVSDEISIQERVRRVARERGLVIESEDQASAVIAISPANCWQRCAGTQLTVTVTYRLNDLFLPKLLGISNISITKSATQTVLNSPRKLPTGRRC
jgi:Flp pilus assembly protein TadG